MSATDPRSVLPPTRLFAVMRKGSTVPTLVSAHAVAFDSGVLVFQTITLYRSSGGTGSDPEGTVSAIPLVSRAFSAGSWEDVEEKAMGEFDTRSVS